MSKKVLECEYCHSIIGEDDKKCPNCGANCSDIIKNYHKQMEIENQKNEEKNNKVGKTVAKGILAYYIISALIALVIIVLIVMFVIGPIFKEVKKQFNNTDNIIDRIDINDKEKLQVEVDSYELFEYHSDHFEQFNTKSGYQKIAFHFVIKNIGKTSVDNFDLVSLKADDSVVEECNIQITAGFDKVVTGKEKYEGLGDDDIKPGETLRGYVGFEVPKDKKELQFTIGNEKVKMDNPVYQK